MKSGIRRAGVLTVLGALLSTLLTAAALTATATSADAKVRYVTTKCADLVIYGLRGSGQSRDVTYSQMGPEVYLAVRNATQRIQGNVTVRLAGVTYPASKPSLTMSAYNDSREMGTTIVRSVLAGTLSDCPRTKIGLIGYSQGAHALHEALTSVRLSTADAKRVVFVGFIADPTYNKNNSNTYLERFGSAAAIENGALGGGKNINSALAAKAIDICHIKDKVCYASTVDKGRLIWDRSDSVHQTFYKQTSSQSRIGLDLYTIMRKNGVV